MADKRYADLLHSLDAEQLSYPGTFEEALAIADTLPRCRTLDVPCGPGRMAEALSRIGFSAYAADLNAAGYRGSAAFCTVDLELGLPYADGAFGFIYCGDGIEHLENPVTLLRELARILTDQGVLVIVTPNYLNVERRLRFLLSGSLAQPIKRLPGYYEGKRFDRGHINPLTLTRLAYFAENAGLELERSQTIGTKKGQRWLAPLAALIVMLGRFETPRRRSNLFADHTQTWSMLMGGKQLFAIFRRVKSRTLAP
ncbi:MAG TPA: class I SAM-dependent methyltransferase [Myxococcales bacterium]|nr:class I SAM-dependent methyltransferase [Myxococcales bacterium]